MSDFISDAGTEINDGFSKLLSDSGNNLLKDLQKEFQQDPSQVLDVLNMMRGASSDMPAGFPSMGDIFGQGGLGHHASNGSEHHKGAFGAADSAVNNIQNIIINSGDGAGSKGGGNPLESILGSAGKALGLGGDSGAGGAGGLLGGLVKEVLPLVEEVLPLAALI